MTANVQLNDLRPCPFCGAPAAQATLKATAFPSRIRVACSDSGCGAHYGYWHPNEWNRRVIESCSQQGQADV